VPQLNLSDDDEAKIDFSIEQSFSLNQLFIERVIVKLFNHYHCDAVITDRIQSVFTSKLTRMGKAIQALGGKEHMKLQSKWKETKWLLELKLPQAPVRSPRVPVLGPCFSCGQYGHLAKMCQKKTVYPLNQPVVSKAVTHKSVISSTDRCDLVTAFKVFTSEVGNKQCVDKHKALVKLMIQIIIRFPLLKWLINKVLTGTRSLVRLMI